MIKGAKLAGAVGALAPTDFVDSKSRVKSRLDPHFLGPIGALDDDVSTDKPEKYLSYCCLKIPIYIAG